MQGAQSYAAKAMRCTTLQEAYERDGWVRVPGRLGASELAAMRSAFNACIASIPFVQNAGALRPEVGTEPAFWALGQEPVFAGLPEIFMTAVRQVFGSGMWAHVEGEQGGFAMPNLPCPSHPWSPCSAAWHVDEATPPGRIPSNVLIGFICLDRLSARGGATVVLTGSTRRLELLADELATPCTTDLAIAHLTTTEPWFPGLLQSTEEETHLSAGVPLAQHELTGEAGDVLLMNPRCLHTTSANTSPRARLLMRMTCVRV
jgi:hypothetical protein